MDSQSLIPAFNERTIIVGTTGCGKTTLAERLCGQYRHVAVFDSKGMLNWSGYKVYSKLRDLVAAKEQKLVYRPDPYELLDPTYAEGFFRWIYLRRNTVCYVDEVFGVTNGQVMPPSYHALLTRGRELGIGVISSTQRPISIPIVLKSEAEHRFIFRLKNDNDRRVAEELSTIPADTLRTIPKHIFYYSNDQFEITGPCKLKL